MIIAVTCRLKKDEQPEGYDFMFETLNRLTQKFPQHRLLYIFDKPFDGKLTFAPNVQPIISGPETKSSLRLQYWYNYRIPALLRKHKADVLLNMEGICSLRTKIPQCLLLTDLRFLDHADLIKGPQARFYKKYTPAFLAKAKSIATVSDFSRSVIVDRYKINADDVHVIKPGIDESFKPIEWEEKELIKEKWAEGRAYFLFSGDINRGSNLINLLRAFSFFKKRQKSSMMLLIAGNADESFKNELKNYKFRSEIKLLESLAKDELAAITAAAYAMVYPVLYTDLALAPLQAMQCGVPVVCSDAGALPSICGNAVLYVNPESIADIAENMMLAFKDENLSGALVKAGKALVQQYQGDKTADLLMQCILKCAD